MSSWAGRRKLIYGGVTVVVILTIIAYIIFNFLYKAPTCSDGLMNGDEKGIDCGGACQRLCQNDFIAPTVAWTSFDQVTPGLYNAAAYIVNPNANGEAVQVPYNIVLYDKDGVPIVYSSGFAHIPPNRNTLAFSGPLSVGKRIPYKVFFEFKAAPNWVKSTDVLSSLAVVNKQYTEEASGSSLLVTLRNSSVMPVGSITVYVVLSDKDSNIIGFSKTKIDGIAGKGSATAPFTWPVSRQGKVISIEVLPVAE